MGDVRSTKTSQHVTIVGGSFASGHALPALIIIAGSSVPEKVARVELATTFVDPTTNKRRFET